ncbi:MAG: hypothetical protein PHQ04_04385 [Opitutaceae bacterium]|nr:hypothetical protein [Opitutaceae bacterium]
MDLNPDLSGIPLPWPAKGDELFGVDGNPHLQATISLRTDLIGHIEGYKRAGDLIFAEFHRSPRLLATGYLVFPGVYLYRHFVELSIKDIIALGNYLENDPSSYPAEHDLDALWSLARGLIERLGPGCTEDDLDAMTRLIAQLNAIDPGNAFRYPMTRDQRPSLSTLPTFNLEQFKSGIEKMSGFFDGARSMLGEYKSTKDSIGW